MKKKVQNYRNLLLMVCLAGIFCSASSVFGLTNNEIIVVINKRMAGAEKLAKYYMEKRGISDDRLLKTSLVLDEVMDREEFDEDLVVPLLKKIDSLKGSPIYGVVLIYGIPLKVRPPTLHWDDEELLQALKKERGQLVKKSGGTTQKEYLEDLVKRIHKLSGENKRAAVDSELALAKVEHYELDGWVPNPYFLGFQKQNTGLKKDDVLMVSRLDGPDLDTVYRIINDSLTAEREGLIGTAYFDARWKEPNERKLSGYKLYDGSLHKAARVVEKRMQVVLNDTEELFAPDVAPSAALYCGWYSLAKYVDSFTWVRGAIGYHIASSECATLKKKDSEVWCLKMLEKGVAATIGPVYEPYVTGFPLPELFFGVLTEGYMNLGESFLVSLPYLSWQMVLIGDPLYTPFSPNSDF
jgi:uncharacterized protein (TIGR03790 family)